ncbi:hypothetical protein KAU33_01565 [Candidatus Dependentiae bacterium]|nr:hypothetical protein [Candidatus Dependentiae bacterium]
MIITPDRKLEDWFKKSMSLVEGYNNIETYYLFKSTYSGVHKIGYSFLDIDNESKVLVSGIEAFDVGNGKILDFIPDKNEYLSLEDTVFFKVMISGTGKYNLQIKEGNKVLYTEEIIVNGEKFHKISLKGFSFGEHILLLSLIGIDTNATKKTSFKYGVGIPDLRTFGIGIRRIREKSYKFSSTVRNTSSLPAENIKTRFILKRNNKTSQIINANSILLIEGGESTGVYAIAENLEYGEYTVIMEVDWDNNIFEKNENNNSTSKQFKVEDKQPPLVIISSPISDKYYGGSMNITATVSDEFAGIEKVTYSIDRKSPKLMTQISGNTLSAVFSNTIDTYKMKDGFHDVKIIARDNNGRRNLNPPQVFFHIDNEIPKVFIGFDSPVIAINRKLYVKNNTSILLRTSILSSEITKYKINNGDWIIYKDPFTLGEQLDGDYTISFFTKNEVGNQSEINTQIVFLDTTPPETKISFEGFKDEADGKIIINKSTKILLKSSDEGCGVKLTKYRINKGAWITYKQPFKLIEINNKNINVEFYSVDKLENQEKVRSMDIKISEQ